MNKLLVAGMLFLSVVSSAETRSSYNDYYMITRSTLPLEPQRLSSGSRGSAQINLLAWTRAGKPLPVPNQPYDREKHFGHWIDDSRDNNCMNTRAKVLFSTSQAPVTYTNKFKCVIASGQWKDHYTGTIVSRADQIQIDHFVPLKQAYTTGAWKWDKKTRCLYGNFLFNNINLLPVSSHENMSKGDRAPDQYMPPDKSVWCGYIRNWLTVKLIWNLAMTPPEAQAISKIFANRACRAEDFVVTENDLSAQRSLIRQNYNYCDYDAPPPGH